MLTNLGPPYNWRKLLRSPCHVSNISLDVVVVVIIIVIVVIMFVI